MKNLSSSSCYELPGMIESFTNVATPQDTQCMCTCIRGTIPSRVCYRYGIAELYT